MDDVVASAEALLQRRLRSRHEAADVGTQLFLMTQRGGGPQEGCIAELRPRFSRAVRDAGFGDVLSSRVAYAVRLAEHGGDLEYEEMSKLFSLAAEVHALHQLGFELPVADLDRLKEVMCDRFSRQKRVARMAAEDRIEDWSWSLWWFREARGL